MKTKTMKTKSILSLTCGLVLLCLGGQANAALTITNGDFQDLTGLINQGGGWYNGVPTGWFSTTPALTYNVLDWNSGNYAANLQTLSTTSPFRPLYQSAGLLDSASKVSLSFNIYHVVAGPNVNLGIFNTNNSNDYNAWTVLTLGQVGGYTSAGRFTLETTGEVAAGTRIGVAFWQGPSGAALIDNVSIIPEPSTGSMMALGLAGLVTTRLLRRKSS
jgi:hypothetical protein